MAQASLISLIDGSVLEGGGQILRNSISLAALLNKPVRVHNIRASRNPPGLKNQHRTGLQLVSEITSAKTSGIANGSKLVEFAPAQDWQSRHLPGTWRADPQTAGSTILLLQISLPLLFFSTNNSKEGNGSRLILRGGTNASSAPQIDYTTNIFLPFLQSHFNSPSVDVSINKRGYHPKGGGEIDFHVPSPLSSGQTLSNCMMLEQGQVVSIHGIAHYAGLPNAIGRDMAQGAEDTLRDSGLINQDGNTIDGNTILPPISISQTRFSPSEALGAGSGIVLYASLSNGGIIGGSALGKKGMPAREVGVAAAGELIRNLRNGGCVDEWLQDQLIIFMALAEGESRVNIGRNEPTLHTRSAIWVAEQLTQAKFSLENDPQNNIIISCRGIGYGACE